MKLTKEEKSERKEWLKKLYSRGGWIVHDVGDFATYCYNPTLGNGDKAKTLRLSCAICAPDDKYKRKYGEYIALHRMFSYEFIYITVPVEVADRISNPDLFRKM
jgi:hypothetical protein